MKKYAFIFPGQGSQYVGMGRSLFESFPAARAAFEEASDILGIDLERVSFEGPREQLDRTEITQPAILAASIAALMTLRERVEVAPLFLAGHSLGEYTALVAAGALSFRDAVRLVHLRGRLMQEAVPEGEGMMYAVLGLDEKAVDEICRRASTGEEIVVPANINSPAQVVISGHSAAAGRAAEIAGEEGARRVVSLKVSAPSHSPLMAGAAERFGRALEEVDFHPFSTPVITNVEAAPLEDPKRVAEILTRQLTSPVRWVDTIRRMKAGGVELVVEIGPGKVLSGLVKRTDRSIETAGLDTAEDLDRVAALFEGPETIN